MLASEVVRVRLIAADLHRRVGMNHFPVPDQLAHAEGVTLVPGPVTWALGDVAWWARGADQRDDGLAQSVALSAAILARRGIYHDAVVRPLADALLVPTWIWRMGSLDHVIRSHLWAPVDLLACTWGARAA